MIKYLCFKLSIFVSFTLAAFLNTAPTSASNEFIQEICPKVYSSKGVTKAGEPFYFGMELIDDSNLKDWDSYSDHVGYMTAKNRGFLVVYAQFSAPDNRRKNSEELTGFTDQEYNQYMDKLYNLGFKKGSDKLTTLEQVDHGNVAFLLSKSTDSQQTYVAYFSKKPVTGKFPFSQSSKRMTLKEFLSRYDDLIITVRVTFEPKEIRYETRGIMKNPKSILDGNYKNTSTILFAYIAHALTKIDPNIKYMYAQPIPSMHKILCRTFTTEEMYVGNGSCGYPSANLVDALKKGEILEDSKSTTGKIEEVASRHPHACTETPHYIKIEALKHLVALNATQP